MGDPAVFAKYSTEELDAIQWDSLEEEMARSAEYDIVPDYDEALDIMNAAKRLRGCRAALDVPARRAPPLRASCVAAARWRAFGAGG